MTVIHMKTFASLGLILGASMSNGQLARTLKLPAISGFLLTGLLAGPALLGILSLEQVKALQPLDHIALSFIALVAGSELKLEALRSRLSSVLGVMFGLTTATFLLTAGAIMALSPWLPALADANQSNLIAASLLLGVIMVARSPSAAIAMINELKAEGRFTQMILGVTVLMDVVVITLFAAALAVAKSLVGGDALSWGFLGGVGSELLVSGVIGLLAARCLAWVFRRSLPQWVSALTLLSLTSGVFYIAEQLHHAALSIGPLHLSYEPLLACLVAGVCLRNMSTEAGDHTAPLEAHIDHLAPWIYLCFFTITGASLELELLLLVWPLAILFFFIRLLGLGIGATIGGIIAKEPSAQHRYRWMGFVTQAGVGLGLAKRVAVEFPSWGVSLSTLIIAVIVMNELLGPLFFKRAIISSGEARGETKSTERS